MTQRLLAVLTLGALSAATAVHLAASAGAQHDHRVEARDRRLFLAAGPRTTAPAPAILVAVRGDCVPSRSLVRVLRRIHDARLTVPPVVIYTDSTWSELAQLAAATPSVTVRIDSTLARRVSATPAAIPEPALHRGDPPTYGVPLVIRLIRNMPVSPVPGDRQHASAD